MKLQYDVEIINKVLNYLGTRPYIESAELIQLLSQGEKIEIPEKVVNKEKSNPKLSKKNE